MNTHKIRILFLLDKSKMNKQGKCPLKCRITYLGKRKTFSTGQSIIPSDWFSKLQLVKPPNEENNNINTQLSLIKSKINRAFLLLQVKELDFDVDDIYNQFIGKSTTAEKTLLDAFDFHINRMQKLVGIDVKQVSVEKYNQSLAHIKTYLKFKYNKKDYLLKDLKLQFLHDFEYYLKTEKKFLPNTVYKTLQRLRRVVRVSVGAEYLTKDPFILHKANKPKPHVIFLTIEELKALEKHQFAQARLQEVKDWFIFSCYTGLAYYEIKHLQKKHIVTGFDGELWIEMKREKTQKNISIPLLPRVRIMIDKYNDVNSKMVFKVCSNQKYNSFLKEIALIVGINKKLSTHTARKTFASTVLLFNDVPMEIVSQLLGHSSISVTEGSYGKVVQRKVSEQMKKLNIKLEK